MEIVCHRLYYGMKEFLEDQIMVKDDSEVDFTPEDDNGFSDFGQSAAEFFIGCINSLQAIRPEMAGVNQYDAHTMTNNFIVAMSKQNVINPNEDSSSRNK